MRIILFFARKYFLMKIWTLSSWYPAIDSSDYFHPTRTNSDRWVIRSPTIIKKAKIGPLWPVIRFRLSDIFRDLSKLWPKNQRRARVHAYLSPGATFINSAVQQSLFCFISVWIFLVVFARKWRILNRSSLFWLPSSCPIYFETSKAARRGQWVSHWFWHSRLV